MKTSTYEEHGIQWTACMQLNDVDFADHLALLSHTHEQIQMKTTSIAAGYRSRLQHTQGKNHDPQIQHME
ncbi:unnamed protein product [Schistosoma margrebowiei]|uniref:Uncharacterized protein n=1 Tax=Schistosoma margrebowiei TaxID=48269 RepID=A0A183L9W8_9TREM|nr:unnamed protein product [Schistosoma margrebowiei]